MSYRNRIVPRPTLPVYVPPVFQRQTTTPQVYIPPNLPDIWYPSPVGTSYDYPVNECNQFLPRNSYYKCPPFVRSWEPRINSGAMRAVNKGGPSDSLDALEHYCEVCKVNCVGKQSYSAHLAGQKHRKKLEQQQQQKTDEPVNENPSNTSYSYEIFQIGCNSRMTHGDHLMGRWHQQQAQLLSTSGKITYFCKPCNISCTGQASYESHLLGSKHRKVSDMISPTTHMECLVCGVECNSRISYEEHLNSQKHQKKVQQQIDDNSCVCKICNIDCKTKAAFMSHIVGKKHCRKAALMKDCKLSVGGRREVDKKPIGSQIPEEGGGKAKDLHCPLCNIKCSGADTYRSHLAGKQHQRAVKLQTARGSTVPDCETVLSGADKRRWSISSPVNVEDCIQEIPVGKVMHYRCRLCECTFSDVKAKNAHENGKRHQTALRNFRAASFHPTPPIPCSSNQSPGNVAMAIGSNVSSTRASESVTQSASESASQSASPRGALKSPSSGSCSSSSKSCLITRAQVPPVGASFGRPPAPFVSPSGMQTSVSLPPHLLADERYIQTKLRCIAPSEEENALMTLAISSVTDALRRILKARGDDAEPSDSGGEVDTVDSEEFTGAFVVSPAAIGLLLGGQRTADMVLVSRELPSPDCVAEVAEELEELLKEACKNHSITVTTVEWTHVLIQMSPKPTASTSTGAGSAVTAAAAGDLVVTVRLRLTSTRMLDIKTETALEQPKSGADDHDHEAHVTAATAAVSAAALPAPYGSGSGGGSGDAHDGDDEQTQVSKAPLCLSPGVCRDALTDVRRAQWLQGAMSAHPTNTVLLNVARLIRCLIRESQPLSWGNFPDYVLVVLLERLSYMDLTPPGAYRGQLPRLRMGLLFRRFLECLSTGVLLSPDGELANLPDPVSEGETLLLADMKQIDRLNATSAAQAALRLVAFRQIYKLFNLPRFVPTCPNNQLAKNGVAMKRRANGDDAEPVQDANSAVLSDFSATAPVAATAKASKSLHPASQAGEVCEDRRGSVA